MYDDDTSAPGPGRWWHPLLVLRALYVFIVGCEGNWIMQERKATEAGGTVLDQDRMPARLCP